MTILVTGAGGFVGRELVRGLLAAGRAVTGLDTMAGGIPAGARAVAGDLGHAAVRADALAGVEAIIHLATVPGGAAEADPAASRRINLDAMYDLMLEAAAVRPGLRFVYASSIAVFGVPLPSRIDDQTPALPTLSYGAHKRVIELLIDDYTRRGFVDGRALRLPGVVVRPALPNGALSGFNSDLIREPLAGRPYLCPVGPQASTWVCSRARVIENLLRIAALPGDAIGPVRTVNAPALSVSVAQIRDALAAVDPAAPARVQFAASPPPELTAQFGAWPLDCSFERARALGLRADSDLTALLRDALSLSISDLPP